MLRAALIAFALLLLPACSLPQQARFEIVQRPWGWSFHNSKDTDVSIDELEVVPERITLKGFALVDKASVPQLANAEQIREYTAQVEALAPALERLTGSLADIVADLAAVASEWSRFRVKISEEGLEAESGSGSGAQNPQPGTVE